MEEQLSQMEKKYSKPLVYMMTDGFSYLIEKAGGQLKSYSLRDGAGDALLVIRAEFEGKAMVAFVGSATAAGCVVKAEKTLRKGEAKWKADMYENSG